MAKVIEEQIREKLEKEFQPEFLELVNESHMHSVPKGSETHFRALIVSTRFEGLSRVARQRLVHETLAYELKNGVHAFSQKTMTPAEWAEANEQVEMSSPPCLGGSLHDSEE